MTACSAGDRPGVRRGRIFAHSFTRSHSFVRRYKRSSMLSIKGRGMLSNAVYLCWIAQVLGRRIGSSCIVKGH